MEREIVREKSGSSSLGLMLLTSVLVVLKATGYIDWSWWWVFAPVWGPMALSLSILVLFGLGALVLLGVGEIADRKKTRRARAARLARSGNSNK